MIGEYFDGHPTPNPLINKGLNDYLFFLNDDHPTEQEWHDINFCLNYHDLSTEYIDEDTYEIVERIC